MKRSISAAPIKEADVSTGGAQGQKELHHAYVAALSLALLLAEELRGFCDNDIHRQQAEQLRNELILANTSVPNTPTSSAASSTPKE